MSLLENITLQMNLDDKNFEREFKDATKTVNKQMDALTLGASAFEAKWEDITSNLRSVKRVASGLAISAAIYGITDAVTSASSAVLNFRNNLEASKISMEYFAQESAQAWEYIRELEDFAAYTPFNTESAISMAQYLQAMSVPINASKSVLTVISDTAAATGATEENMQRIVTALGQVLTKGKLAAEEVRQLANANIPIYDILKEQLDLTGQEIKNLGNLNINASKAVVAILDGLKERYEGASAKIADTLGGMTETIKDDALIIGEAFFHGTLDRLEDRIRSIRDKLDEWRDIALHQGTGGMIEAIIGDLDKNGTGDLEQFIIAAIAGFKNLGDTIEEFVTHNGNALKVFAKTAYASVMSLTIAADYLLRAFNAVQKVGEDVVDVINRFTGMSLTLSDVVAGLLVFKTVGNTLYFAGNTALWAGKQFVTLGTNLTAVLPIISNASAFTRGLVSGLITLGAAATTAYLGLKAIQGATGVTGDSTLVTDEYKQQMEEYNKSLEQWEDSLNQDYTAIADNWAAQMSDALDDTEKKAKKTAKKIQKTWLMSFDEVFQIREDPDDKGLNDELEKFEDIDWGQFFTLPEFRFPERALEENTEASYSIADAIDTAQDQLGALNLLLPGLISGTTVIGTILKNRQDYIRKTAGTGEVADELLSEKELAAKLDEDFAEYKNADDLLGKMSDEYVKQTKVAQAVEADVEKLRTDVAEIERDLHKAQVKELGQPTTENKQLVDKLSEQLTVSKKQLYAAELERPDSAMRTQIVQRLERLQKQQTRLQEKILDRQIKTSDARVIDSPGGGKAAAVLSADKLNKKIAAIQDSLNTLGKQNNTRNEVLRELAAGNNITGATDRLALEDSRIKSLTTTIDRDIRKLATDYLDHLGHFADANGIDVAAIDSILRSNIRSIQQRVNTLTRVISTNYLEALPDILSKMSDTPSEISKSFATYLSTQATFGKAPDDELISTINKQLAALISAEQKIGKYARAVNELNQRLEIQASPETNTGINQRDIDALKERIATDYRAEAIIGQNAVKVRDISASRVIELLDNISANDRTLFALTDAATTQRVNAVNSIANEIKALLANDVTYTTSQTVWQDRVRDILQRLIDDVAQLPDISETKALSTAFLDTLSKMIGVSAADNDILTFTSLDTLIDKYTNEALAAIKKSGNTIFDLVQSEVQELKNIGILSYTQSDKLTKLIKHVDESKAAIDALSISSAAYSAERTVYTAFDDAIQQLTNHASISTNTVQELYANLAATLKNSIGLTDARNAVNRLLATVKPETLAVANTGEVIKQIWDSTDISRAIASVPDIIDRKLKTVKFEADPLAGIPAKGISTLLDPLRESLDAQFNSYKELVFSHKGIVSSEQRALREAAEVIELLEEFQDVIADAAEGDGSINYLLRERFDINGLYQGYSVPEPLVDRLQLTTNAEQLQGIIDEIKELSAANDKLTTAIKNAAKEAEEIVYTAINTSKYDSPSLRYFDDNALQGFLDDIKEIEELRAGTDVETRKLLKEETDDIRWLASKYDTREFVPGGFERQTGAYKAVDFLNNSRLPNRFAGLYGAEDSVLEAPLNGPQQNLRLGPFAGSMTEQGVTAQGAIAKMLGAAVQDEIVESIKANAQTGMAKAFNTRVRAALKELVGSLYTGSAGTGADATGTFGIRLHGMAELSDGVYGLRQRIAISDKSASLLINELKALDREADNVIEAANGVITVVNFSTFEKALRNTAPDLVSNVASSLLAGNKLKGIIVSALDASADKFKVLTDNVYNWLDKMQGQSPREIQKWAEHTIASAMRRNDFDNSAYAAHMQTIVVKPDSSLEAYKQTFERNAILLRDAAEAQRVANAYGYSFDLTPTTTYGTAADATARYQARTADALRNVSGASESFETAIKPALEAAHAAEKEFMRIELSLANFDEYVHTIVAEGLDSGDIRSVQTTLKNLENSINKKTVKSFDNLAIGAKQVMFNLVESDPSEVFEALQKTVLELQDVVNSSVPKLLVTYNDTYSKIVRRLADIIDTGDTSTLSSTLDDLNTAFYTINATAEKLESAYGMLDREISRRWMELQTAGDLNIFNVTDPFRYLNLEESVGKMFADLQELTGQSITELTASLNISPEDISRYAGYVNKYQLTAEEATGYKVYEQQLKPQVPYIGEHDALLTGADEIADAAHNMSEVASTATNAAEAAARAAAQAGKATASADNAAQAVNNMLKLSEENMAEYLRIPFEDTDEYLRIPFEDIVESSRSPYLAEELIDPDIFAAIKDWTRQQGDDILEWFKQLYTDAKNGFKNISITDFINNIKQQLSSIGSSIKTNVSSITDWFKGAPWPDEDTDIMTRLFAMGNGKGLTNNDWFNAFADAFTAEEIGLRASEEQQKVYAKLLNDLFAGMDDTTKDAFIRGDSLAGYESIDDAGDALRKAAQEAFGDDFDAFDDIVKAVNNPDYVSGSFFAKTFAGFANAMDNSFVKTMLQPNAVGISGFDVVAAVAQSVNALSEGFDDYAAMATRWNASTGYDIRGLDGNGKLDKNNNLVSLGDAGLVGLENLLIEGILTNVLQDAAAGAVGGLPGMAIGAIAALITNLGMLATGAYDVSNVASESIKEMLNNHDFVAKQVKEQGGSDKEAREAQLNVARDLYTNYYNEMSSVWSMFDKSSIRELTENKGSFGARYYNEGAYATSALRYAVNEIVNADQKGATKKNGRIVNAYGGVDGLALDTDKVYEQLYTLYTTGGVNKIEDFNKMGFWGKLTKDNLTDLESDWLSHFKDMDELSKARLDDLFSLQREAADYITSRGEEATRALLSAYGIIADDVTQMIEGVVWLYETAVNEMDRKMQAKAAAILSGDVTAVDLAALATGSGSVNRLLDGDISTIEQQYLDTLSTATGVYLQAMSDTMYAMTYNIEDVRDKMTGFTVTFPESIRVGTDTFTVKEIASDTNAVSILNGMGININADGTVTVSTQAVNANESGHSRTMNFDYSDISSFELSQLRDRGISLFDKYGSTDEVGLSLQESGIATAIKGLTYNLSGVSLTNVSDAAIEALKAQGISLTQDQETGRTVATISDAGYITGSRDITTLLAGLDPGILERMSTNLKDALKGIDAINAFGASHGESRIGSAAGIEVDTGFAQGDYSAALEQAFAKAGVTLKAAVDSEGNEVVYAAINNVGEQWHKAITQWKTSDVDKNPALRSFLDELGAEVYTSGDYTMVSTESILDELASGNKSKLTEILFDNAEMWEQFPEDTRQAFINAGVATEDGFITLSGEMLDGWHRYQIDGVDALGMAYEAMDAKTFEAFSRLQGNSILQYGALNNEQLYWLKQLGITSEAQYGKNADELLALVTGKMGLLKDGNLLAWENLSSSQIAQLNELGIKTEADYTAHAEALRTLSNDEMGLLHDDTVKDWDELSDTSLAKLHAMGINNKEDYEAYLSSMNVTTGTKMSELDTTTQQKLAALGTTTGEGWGAIKQVTDDTLSETEKLALGYMKFSDLPKTIQDALAKDVEGSAYEALHDSWWAINTDADTQLSAFDATVDSMAYSVSRVKDLAQQLKAALADPALQAEGLQANLASFQATAIEAAKSSSNKWSDAGGRSYTVKNGALVKDTDKDKGGKLWKDWDNDIQAANSLIAINEGRPDNAGNPMVYYIYNMYVAGEKAQVIRNTDGVLQKVMGGWYYNADNNIPEFKMGGMVTGDGLFRAGEFGLNEAIVPLEQPQAMHAIGTALAAAVPTWELVAPLASMLGQRDGGVAQFSSFHSEKAESSVEDIVSRIMEAQAHRAPQPSYNGGSDDRRPLYVGTLIADKAGLRELDRQMKRVVKQDGGR